MSRSTNTLPLSRPPFPSGWSAIPLTPSNLTLANTLPVGQSFLWHRHVLPSSASSSTTTPPTPSLSASASLGPELEPTEEFSRAVHDPPRVICLRQTPDRIWFTAIHPTSNATEKDRIEGTTKAWLEDYFHLTKHPELDEMYDEWRDRDAELFGTVDLEGRAKGVRVLRQDPWECLVAFITSTNNHIPRIASLMHRLSQHFSEPLLTLSDPSPPSAEAKAGEEDSGEPTTTYHLFPPPHILPAELETTLRELGFGYRAGFIESSLATLRAEFGAEPRDIEKGLETLRMTEVDVVRDKLLALKGVGRKVADCVMLMCLDQPSLIPVDTHVAAIAARHPSFPSRLRNKPMSKQVYDEVQSFLLDRWGPMGGWCQAVMFAADLPSATVNRTPRALVKTKTETKVKVKVKIELDTEVVGMGMTGSPGTPASTALMTPRDDKAGWIEESPLKNRGRGSSKGKRKAERIEEVLCVKQEVDELPAAFAFKRTRSAARIELKREASGVSSVAGRVEELEV